MFIAVEDSVSQVALTLGFEQLINAFDKLDESNTDSKLQNYPPYNIRKTNDTDYSIEIAIAGNHP